MGSNCFDLNCITLAISPSHLDGIPEIIHIKHLKLYADIEMPDSHPRHLDGGPQHPDDHPEQLEAVHAGLKGIPVNL